MAPRFCRRGHGNGGRLCLKVALAVHNSGTRDFSVTAALHTYLRVADIAAVAVRGLQGVRYRDSVTGRDACSDDAETLAIFLWGRRKAAKRGHAAGTDLRERFLNASMPLTPLAQVAEYFPE